MPTVECIQQETVAAIRKEVTLTLPYAQILFYLNIPQTVIIN